MGETMRYTQANRAMRVTTPLEEDELLLAGFNGEETVSQLFRYQLDLMSTSGDVDGKALLGQPMTVTLVTAGGGARKFNGIVNRFAIIGRDDDLYHYRAELVPKLWLLTRRVDSRIFQELTVPQIVERVLKDRGVSEFRIDCMAHYRKREFCVQYRETDFDFVSRLLEEEGIFYYFHHSDDEHTLVLTDSNSSLPVVPEPAEIEFMSQRHVDQDVITRWERLHELRPGKYTVWDYCFETPDSRLEATVDGDNEFEIYDYPGGYQKREEGEVYARIRLEAHEVLRETIRGRGTARHLIPGHTFTLARHFTDDGEYMLTRVRHAAELGDYRSDRGGALDYEVEFDAIPLAVPFRPQRVTKKPTIRGTQTALVVGKQGEELWVDKYGRVKIQFHWDREGKKDENSSCWVRVAMPWAGKGWGSVSLPRIGNEVVVSFLEGDPDRPLIVGSVYNANQTPPFDLPGTGIQMGMKSRSSPGGGGYNEITMTDTKGKEQITIHGQYDMSTTVGNDQTNTINNNRTTSVAVDDTESIGANQNVSIGADQATTVGGNQKTDVAGNQEVSVGGNRQVGVGGNDELSVGGNRKASTGGNDELSVGGNLSISVSSNGELTVGSNLKGAAGTKIELSAGAEVSITAGAKITLSAGGSTIEIGPSGVTVTTGAIVAVTGSTIKLN